MKLQRWDMTQWSPDAPWDNQPFCKKMSQSHKERPHRSSLTADPGKVPAAQREEFLQQIPHGQYLGKAFLKGFLGPGKYIPL